MLVPKGLELGRRLLLFSRRISMQRKITRRSCFLATSPWCKKSSRAPFKITVLSPVASYGSLPKEKLEKVSPLVRMLLRAVSVPRTFGISNAEMPHNILYICYIRVCAIILYRVYINIIYTRVHMCTYRINILYENIVLKIPARNVSLPVCR